jgi:hypothetical protein
MLGMPFSFVVDGRNKTPSKSSQLLSKKIGNLIGYGIYRLDYLKDPEVDIFRRQMIRYAVENAFILTF